MNLSTNQLINQSTNQLLYTLSLADNALILGHRISEWCGHGPVLEQDIALTNTSLDHLGAARSLYQYAAEQFNALDKATQDEIFTSPALDAARARIKADPVKATANNTTHLSPDESTDQPVTEDDLAYLRDGWDFRNLLLLEQPNRDWAYTIVRSFCYDAFQYFYLQELQSSRDETLAAIAEKSLKETTYHLRWSSEWLIRLGDGTAESAARAQAALNEWWPYTGEMFTPADYETAMLQAGIAPDPAKVKESWNARVASVLEEAALKQPAGAWMQQGGKEGRHTEHLGYALAELQFMQRAYPGMAW